jgi:hypothetical protein
MSFSFTRVAPNRLHPPITWYTYIAHWQVHNMPRPNPGVLLIIRAIRSIRAICVLHPELRMLR